MKLHIDGARIYNAAVKLNVPLHELVADADSVTLCFSKVVQPNKFRTIFRVSVLPSVPSLQVVKNSSTGSKM